MPRWVKLTLWLGVFGVCAGVGAFVAAHTNPFPPGVEDPGSRPTTPTPTSGASTSQRWSLAMNSATRHDLHVGGSCRSRWHTSGRSHDPSGRLRRGTGSRRPPGVGLRLPRGAGANPNRDAGRHRRGVRRSPRPSLLGDRSGSHRLAGPGGVQGDDPAADRQGPARERPWRGPHESRSTRRRPRPIHERRADLPGLRN